MKLRSVVEVLSAGHQSHLVNSPKEFRAAGGMMFSAPVGQFKTVITKTLDLWKPQACVMTDLTIRELGEMRAEISLGKITTLAFLEFPKLYARNKDVASNVEGAIQLMADEGMRQVNWKPQDMTMREARAFIVGAMPTHFYERKHREWKNSGFARRFLWCHYQLADPEIVMDAIDAWKPLDFGKLIYSFPASKSIPFNCSEADSAFLRGILRGTRDGYEAVPFLLLKKIMAVLKWRYSDLGEKAAGENAIEILADFAQCLQGVADLEIDPAVISTAELLEKLKEIEPPQIEPQEPKGAKPSRGKSRRGRVKAKRNKGRSNGRSGGDVGEYGDEDQMEA